MSLIHWWPLNGDTKDYGINGINLTNNGATVDNAGKIGKCYSFNDTKYMVASNDLTSSNTEFSFAGWAYLTSVTNSNSAYVYSCRTSSGGPGLFISLERSLCVFDDGTRWQANYQMPLTTWVHFVFTRDLNGKKLYINGELKDSTTTIGNLSGIHNKMYVGKNFSADTPSSLNTDIKLNDFRIYNHVLSKKEIKELSKGLMLHYNFENYYQTSTRNLYANTNSIVGNLTVGGGNITNEGLFIDSDGSTYYTYKVNRTGTGSDVWPYMRGVHFAFTPDKRYYYSCYVRIKECSNVIMRLRASRGDNDWGTNNVILVNSSMQKNEWIRIETNRIIPETYTKSGSTYNSDPLLEIYGDSLKTSGTVYTCEFDIKNVQVVESDYSVPFVDGSAENEISDGSGYRNIATINGNCKLATPSNSGNYCMLFENGVTDYLSSSTFIWPKDKITISFWWKSNNTSPTGNYHIPISSSGNPDGLYEISITNTGQIRGGLYINGTRYVNNGTSTKLLDGNWHLCTMTYDGTIIRRYVDAVQENNTSINGTMTGATGFIIGHYGNNTNYGTKNGYISDIKIYSTALSADDIKAEYNRKASIDKQGNLFASEFVEGTNANSNITRKGQAISNIFATTMQLDDSSIWAPICVHYVPDGLNTTSSNKYSFTKETIWNCFGSIGDLPRPENGQYEFYVMQQTDVDGAFSWFRWKQTVNPLTATWSDVNPSKVGTNVTRISSSETSTYGGMYWTTGNAPMTFANSNNGNWYGCGIKAYHQGGIPGYNGKTVKGWQLVYMRVTKNNLRLFKNGLLISTDIIEN